MTLPRLAPYRDSLSFVLVGSVATGLCDETSDIDIAILCDEATYHLIAEGTSWSTGRPTEVHLDNVQLHYYAVAFKEIRRKLRALDDVYIYVYSTAVTLWDAGDQYAKRLGDLLADNPRVRKQRIEGKLDMLIRRSRALRASLASGDVICVGQLCFETLVRCLKTTALLDNLPFDPRKRLFRTAIAGPLGQQLEPKLRLLLSTIGDLGQIGDAAGLAAFSFPDRLDEMVGILTNEARAQRFRVGLDKPDRRQV
jgi:predicted nucleotidyltransferase